MDKKTTSYEIGLFPSEVERKHNYTNELSFTGRPAGYSEIHIDLDLQRHGMQHVTWADADKSMYFVWHHCFHLLLNENIDKSSNGVDGFCGKHYSQDFISFLNDAGDRKVFTAVLSQWNECPGRPKVYSPCIS